MGFNMLGRGPHKGSETQNQAAKRANLTAESTIIMDRDRTYQPPGRPKLPKPLCTYEYIVAVVLARNRETGSEGGTKNSDIIMVLIVGHSALTCCGMGRVGCDRSSALLPITASV